MLKAYEMESSGGEKKKSIALMAEEESPEFEELQQSLGLLARRFSKAFKKGGGGSRFSDSKRTNEGTKNGPRSDTQCFECKGYGHFKNECPTAKRKEERCEECKGFGHTQQECLADQKRNKDRSLVSIEEDESEESDEDLDNFVAFTGFANDQEDAESRTEGGMEPSYGDIKKEYQRVCEELLKTNWAYSRQQEELAQQSSLIKHLQKEIEEERLNAFGLGSELSAQSSKLELLLGTKDLDQLLNQQKIRPGPRCYGKSNKNRVVRRNTRSYGSDTPYATPPTTSEEDLDLGSCYICGSFQHFKADCPENKRRKHGPIQKGTQPTTLTHRTREPRKRNYSMNEEMDSCMRYSNT